MLYYVAMIINKKYIFLVVMLSMPCGLPASDYIRYDRSELEARYKAAAELNRIIRRADGLPENSYPEASGLSLVPLKGEAERLENQNFLLRVLVSDRMRLLRGGGAKTRH